MQTKYLTLFILLNLAINAFASTPTSQESTWENNPFLYSEEYSPIHPYKVPRQRKLVQTQVILVDTRDEEKCRRIQREAEDMGIHSPDFCKPDSQRPWRSLTLHRPSTEKELRMGVGPQSEINKATSRYMIAGVAALAFLYSLPTEVTNWSDEERSFSQSVDEYFRNIKKGPVIDRDSWYFNYAIHPVVGGWYYTSARHAGLSQGKSLSYTFLMSTFYWEYGFESIFEIPSIQDILITPLAGVLFGEMFFHLEQEIRAQGGRMGGSKVLGQVLLFLINPVEVLAKAINKGTRYKLIKRTDFRIGVFPAGMNRLAVGIALSLIYD